MPKITLNDIANLQNETSAVNTINNNSAAIEAAIENTLSRDGTAPNEMNANLDMNNYRVFNLPAATSPTEPIRKAELDPLIGDISKANQFAQEAKDARDFAQAQANYAEQQAERAEDARDLAADYAFIAAGLAEVMIFSTVDGMGAIDVPAELTTIRVYGQSSPGDGGGGLYREVANTGQLMGNQFLTNSNSRRWQRVARPHIILVSGQSNVGMTPAFNWTPAPNVYRWSWPGLNSTGNRFVAMNDDSINWSHKAASDIAAANPDWDVIVIRIGNGGRPIAHWLPGGANTTAPEWDAYADIKNNVEACLAVIGVDHINEFWWWQGESDVTSLGGYTNKFESLIARLRGETWFQRNTPIRIMGLASQAISGDPNFKYMNTHLQTCVNREPDVRSFIYTPGVIPVGLWADTLHPSAEGHVALGSVVAQQALSHVGRGALANILYNVEDDRIGFGGAAPAAFDFEFLKNKNATTTLVVGNNDANGNAANAQLQVFTTKGSIRLTAFGAGTGSNAGASIIDWTGSGNLGVTSGGGLLLGSGGVNNRIRLTDDGFFCFPHGLVEASDNTSAAGAGVPVGGLYRTSDGTVKIRTA